MGHDSLTFSYCIGAYNEEKIALKSILVFKKNLTKILGNKNFEVIIVENGSTDKTKEILKSVKDPKIRIYFAKQKGHGLALRMAVKKARFDYCVITGMDIPFGFNDLKRAIKLVKKYDLVFGSKAHPDSKVSKTPTRILASIIFRSLQKIFFNLSIGDTQGSIFFDRRKILAIIDDCLANDSFFMTQLAIYSQQRGYSICEIPVDMSNQLERKSTYHIFRDGKAMLLSMVKQYYKLHLLVN